MGVTCPQSGYTNKRTNLGNSRREALTGRQTPQLFSKTHSRMAQAASVLDLRDRGRERHRAGWSAHKPAKHRDFRVQCVY